MLATIMKTAPYNFPYAGNVYNGSLVNVGSVGLYWSRTVYSSDSRDAYGLWFGSSGVRPASGNGRSLGFSVRCVATT